MSTAAKAAGIQDDYAAKIASDLAENQTTQEQVRNELQRLQEELLQLEDNSRVLQKMQQALGITVEAASPAAVKGSATRAAVPSARSASQAAKKTKASATKTATPAKTSRAKQTPAKAASPTKDAGPSWLELVSAVFAGRTEPKSAAEVAENVSTSHPERTVQAAVIRNTLENAVARGILERSKQGRSVYYAPVSAASPVVEAADSPTPQPAS
ncbi:hypothetical protein ACWGQT_00880 [Streptomyces yangpuensis]